MGFTSHTFQVYSSLYKTAGRELPKAFHPAPAHATPPPPVTLPAPKGNAPGHVPGTIAHPARGRSISPSPFANSGVSAGEADPFIYAPALLAMTALKAQCTIHVWLWEATDRHIWQVPMGKKRQFSRCPQASFCTWILCVVQQRVCGVCPSRNVILHLTIGRCNASKRRAECGRQLPAAAQPLRRAGMPQQAAQE
jgi:hypothetical protein